MFSFRIMDFKPFFLIINYSKTNCVEFNSGFKKIKNDSIRDFLKIISNVEKYMGEIMLSETTHGHEISNTSLLGYQYISKILIYV